MFCIILCFVGTQSRTAVGRPIAVAATTVTATSNLATPQKYVLMSQRPTVSQVILLVYSLIK